MNCFVFDVDGTLIDTEYGHMESLRLMLIERCGKEYTYNELRRFFGMPGLETLNELGADDPDGSNINRWRELFNETSADSVHMFKGMKEVLDIIKSRNIPMGVVTSQCGDELEKTFKKHKLQNYFEIAVHADLTELHKPHADPLNKFFELSEISKEGAVYVGDSKHDWMCAKAAGVKFCLAGWGCGNPEAIVPDYFFAHPHSLLNLL